MAARASEQHQRRNGCPSQQAPAAAAGAQAAGADRPPIRASLPQALQVLKDKLTTAQGEVRNAIAYEKLNPEQRQGGCPAGVGGGAACMFVRTD
jgi:hypothetical protein